MGTFVITVAQEKGGVGKTTLATQLASAFHCLSYHVAIIDVDPQQSMTRWHELRQKLDIHNPILLKGSAWQADSLIKKATPDHDIVLVDCPPRADAKVSVAFRASDIILLPCQPAAADVWALDDTLNFIESHMDKVKIVMNRVPPRSKKSKLIIDALTKRHLPLCHHYLGNRTAFGDSMSEGLGVAEGRSCPAQDEIYQLAKELLRVA